MLKENNGSVAIESVLLDINKANATIEEKLERQQNDRILHATRRSAAKQSTFDTQRIASNKFRQKDIYTGPSNPCYCCSCLCYNNIRLFIAADDRSSSQCMTVS